MTTVASNNVSTGLSAFTPPLPAGNGSTYYDAVIALQHADAAVLTKVTALAAGLSAVQAISAVAASGGGIGSMLFFGGNYGDGLVSINFADGVVTIGDGAGDGNGTYFTVDDSRGTATLSASTFSLGGVASNPANPPPSVPIVFPGGSKLQKVGTHLTYTDAKGHVTNLATDT